MFSVAYFVGTGVLRLKEAFSWKCTSPPGSNHSHDVRYRSRHDRFHTKSVKQ